MKIDYQLEYRKQLQINISLVRNEIDNPDFVLKITNHAEKFGREYDEVKSKIMTDDMYAEWFAKDPAKQNIYEKLAASYISGIEDVVDFRNLPNSAKMFIVEGKVTSERLMMLNLLTFTLKLVIITFMLHINISKPLMGVLKIINIMISETF